MQRPPTEAKFLCPLDVEPGKEGRRAEVRRAVVTKELDDRELEDGGECGPDWQRPTARREPEPALVLAM